MSEIQRSMFNREIDFSLEETINSYEACRALSQRARDINGRFRNVPEGSEAKALNPTVGAFSDYAVGRIVLKKDGQLLDDTKDK